MTEDEVADLAAVLRTDASIDTKVNQINFIKVKIKGNYVPDTCVVSVFDSLRTAMSSQHGAIARAGFAAMNHLITRLSRQDPKYVVREAGRTLPLIIEKIGDPKDSLRNTALACLTGVWNQAPLDVERVIKNAGLVGKNSRNKESSMTWIVKVIKVSNQLI